MWQIRVQIYSRLKFKVSGHPGSNNFSVILAIIGSFGVTVKFRVLEYKLLCYSDFMIPPILENSRRI